MATASVCVPPHGSAYCDSYVLSRELFHDICAVFPSFRHRIQKIKDQRDRQNKTFGVDERMSKAGAASTRGSAAAPAAAADDDAMQSMEA